MDPGSAEDFNVGYHSVVKQRKGIFQTDAALLDDDAMNLYVQQHSTFLGLAGFFLEFAASMVKMGQIGVLSGGAGQIRKFCSVVNKYASWWLLIGSDLIAVLSQPPRIDIEVDKGPTERRLQHHRVKQAGGNGGVVEVNRVKETGG